MAGVIAAGSPQTAQAGAEILQAGGNAVDAAVGAAFASMVAEASISSMGGGGFAIVQGADIDPVLYDFFVAMPGKANNIPKKTRAGDPVNDPEVDFQAVPVLFADKTDTYYVGRGSTAVPGNPAGLAQLLADMGTMPLHVVLEPAIQLARDGFPIDAKQVEIAKTIEGIVRFTSPSGALFTRDNAFIKAGMLFQNTAFADTLEYFGKHGVDSFYQGALADAIVEDHKTYGGLVSHDDLQAYEVIKRKPIHIQYRDHDLFTNPPPANGGILIAYALRLLARADLASLEFHSAEHVRLLLEIMRQADRLRQKFDPAHLPNWHDVLMDSWIDRDWLTVQQALQATRSTPSTEDTGGIDGKSRSTTHISVMDSDGLAIGISTTPGGTGGYVVGDTGMLMNNILGETDLNPTGFHQMPIGSRLGSMMSPTLINHKDGGRGVIGSAGSSRIRSAIMQSISRWLDWEMPFEDVINRSRIHFENDSLELEYGYDEATAIALTQQGYDVNRWGVTNLYFGGAHIAYRSLDGQLAGVGDHRRGGKAIIVE